MESKNVRTNVMLPKELHQTMKKEAARLGLSLSGFICVAANEYLKQTSFVDMVQIMQEIKQDPDKMSKEFVGIVNTVLSSGSPDGVPAVLSRGPHRRNDAKKE